MEPTPETAEALSLLAARGEHELLEYLVETSRGAQEVVPACVGLSVTVVDRGLTLCLVATDDRLAVMEAVQYLDGGPCLAAIAEEEDIEVGDLDLLDEDTWRMFAAAGAAQGIASTLSLPFRDGERVIGSVNLYAATPDAFAGHHEEIAEIFGAWAPGAVTNADLSFSTRHEAVHAPERLRERDEIAEAVEVLANVQRTDEATAEQRLRDAAARAGITATQVARAVVAMRP